MGYQNNFLQKAADLYSKVPAGVKKAALAIPIAGALVLSSGNKSIDNYVGLNSTAQAQEIASVDYSSFANSLIDRYIAAGKTDKAFTVDKGLANELERLYDVPVDNIGPESRKMIAELFHNYGAVLNKKGDTEGTILSLNKALDYDRSAKTLSALSATYFVKKKDVNTALDYARQALQLDPKITFPKKLVEKFG